MVRRPAPFAVWAVEASGAAEEFAGELARVEAEVPLSAMPELVVSLSGLAERAGESLRLTGQLAAAEAAAKKDRAADGPRELAAAAKHTARAGEILSDARGRIRKDLARAEVEEDPDGWPLRPAPSGAYWSLASLNSAISRTKPSDDGVLAGLVTTAEELALVLKSARRPVGPVADAIRDAYRQMPEGIARRRPAAADLVQRAGGELGRATGRVRAAVQALTEDLDRDQIARKQGVPQ